MEDKRKTRTGPRPGSGAGRPSKPGRTVTTSFRVGAASLATCKKHGVKVNQAVRELVDGLAEMAEGVVGQGVVAPVKNTGVVRSTMNNFLK